MASPSSVYRSYMQATLGSCAAMANNHILIATETSPSHVLQCVYCRMGWMWRSRPDANLREDVPLCVKRGCPFHLSTRHLRKGVALCLAQRVLEAHTNSARAHT